MICLRAKASSCCDKAVPRFAACPMLPQIRLGGVVTVEFGTKQFDVSENSGQQIVEIMRHATGQPRPMLSIFLCLEKLLLEAFAFRDVDGNPADRVDHALRRHAAEISRCESGERHLAVQ